MMKIENGNIKRLILNSLGKENENGKITLSLLEKVDYDFGENFEKNVLAKIVDTGKLIRHEFDRHLRLAFRNVSIAAAVALILMMLSIFLKEGNLSVDVLLGIEDINSESIVYLLMGD